MGGLKTTITIILLLSLCTVAYPQEEPGSTKGEPGSVQEKAAAANDDDRLPLYKEGWQLFLAPYLWIPGVHGDLSHQGKFSGTTIVDVPWYDLVPLLFSKAIGGMGRAELWNGRWGLFSDTNFVYIGDSVTASGATELKLNARRLPITIPVSLQLSGDVKFWTRLLFQDVGVRYLLGSVPLCAGQQVPVLSCELLGGLRYTYLNQATSLGLNATLTGPLGNVSITRGGSFSDDASLSVAEPLIGLRFGLWFTPKLNLLLKADCGGFGIVAYNNVDSVIEAEVGYQERKNMHIYAGYRARYASLSSTDVAIHGWLHGPMLGTVFSF
jgi:hypothetical protein